MFDVPDDPEAEAGVLTQMREQLQRARDELRAAGNAGVQTPEHQQAVREALGCYQSAIALTEKMMNVKRIKIAVVIDANGRWSAVGGTNYDGDEVTDMSMETCASFALDALPDDTTPYRVYHVTAELNVPSVVEIPGRVEGPGDE